jgi:hypothetical protein
MKRDGQPIDADALAVSRGLHAAGTIGTASGLHDRERLACREHMTMTGARVIGMSMRDQCARDRTERIDVEVPGGAVEACRRRGEEV